MNVSFNERLSLATNPSTPADVLVKLAKNKIDAEQMIKTLKIR